MAYQAKRSRHYVEQMELVDECGNVQHTLTVDLDPGSVAENLSKKYVELVNIQRKSQEISTDDPEQMKEAYSTLGNAVLSMIEAVFGDENTEVIKNFYGNHYTEMVTEIMPFITDVVVPQVRKLAHDQKKNVLQKYNRKQRRAILKKVR